ncbi:hypothetical protein D9611_007288 [Ephemerocybe angulata]|uniref:G domain-containing protein n=1 Tax=Ephemerocybe angulata TaxID=980116 RepID=A0A8H5CF82_9AGAR|nr:hypothetical protein D9611_007288 [Tulosesus angulatus]
MSQDLKEQVIAVIGKFDSGKTTFIKAVRDATSNATHTRPSAEEAPTLGVVEYRVPLPGGRLLTFIDTPGLDGYQAGGEKAKETEEILRMLEEHITAKGEIARFTPVTHVLVFLSANDINSSEFKGRARRTFERLFPNSQVACITTHWDQIEGDDGLPITVEEAKSKEESIYASATSGSLLEYLHAGREGNVLRFRSGLSIEGYSFPQDIIHKLFGGQASDPTLEERLVAMTKERDDLAAKYALLLQEKGGPTTLGEASPGPKDPSEDSTLDSKDVTRTPRTGEVTELEREALDVAHECKSNRQKSETAFAELKNTGSRFAEGLGNLDAVVDEYTSLRQGKDIFEEQERSLTAELNAPQSPGSQSSVRAIPAGTKQRFVLRLQEAQANLKETERLMALVAGDYRQGCAKVELEAAQIAKLKRIVQGKERELGEWLLPESEWFTKELENFRALQTSISTSLDAMRSGLEDGWEGKLGDNTVFLEGLGGYTVHSEMVAHPEDWAPAIESFYLSQVSLALSQEMVKFHSAVLERLKIQEKSAQREWKNGSEAIFGQRVPSFMKSSLPQLIPFTEEPGVGVTVTVGPSGDPIVPSEDPIVPSPDPIVPSPDPIMPSEDPIVLADQPGSGVPHDHLPLPSRPLVGNGGVMSVVFSLDGTKVVSGSTDNTIRVWDASTGQVQKVLTGHTANCTSVAISGDGSWIVSGSDDRTVRTWDVMTGKEKQVLLGHTGAVKAVAVSWDGTRICSGGDDHRVRAWDAATGAVQSIMEGHTGGVNSVAFSRDGKWIASGAWDQTIRVWGAPSTKRVWGASSTKSKLQKVLQGHNNGVMSVAFSMDGTRIVSASSDCTGKVWDASTGSLLRTLVGHTRIVMSIALSPDARRIISGSYDHTLRVWDASTGEVQNVLAEHSGIVWSVAFSSDGRRVATGSFDTTIRIWDLSEPASLSH